MGTKEYILLLAHDARKRHYHETVRGKIVRFVVQLEIYHRDKWWPVVRFDSAHGFSHTDRYNIKGEKRKEILDLPFEEATTLADIDINENWDHYRGRFLRGMFP